MRFPGTQSSKRFGALQPLGSGHLNGRCLRGWFQILPNIALIRIPSRQPLKNQKPASKETTDLYKVGC